MSYRTSIYSQHRVTQRRCCIHSGSLLTSWTQRSRHPSVDQLHPEDTGRLSPVNSHDGKCRLLRDTHNTQGRFTGWFTYETDIVPITNTMLTTILQFYQACPAVQKGVQVTQKVW